MNPIATTFARQETAQRGHTTMLPARHITACVFLGALAVSSPQALGDLTQDIMQLISDKVTGGETGFLLKQINGPVLASDQPDYLFYPASTIKVLQHVHAMLEVEDGAHVTCALCCQDGPLQLNTQVVVYDIGAESCADDHDGHTPTCRALEDVLRRMMEASDNQDSNAVQELFGRPAINDTAHGVIGMSADTQLNHKFGCLGPSSDPVNQMPLLDAILLYERVALGQIFALESTRQTFYDLMNDESDNTTTKTDLFAMIDGEADLVGMTDSDAGDFKAGIRMAWKPGNIGTVYESRAGWILLPSHPCSTLPPREYVYGAFFDAVTNVSPTFSTINVVREMLRGEVRAALEDWQACESCGEAGAGPCNEAHGDVGCSDADCCQTVCLVDPLCCDPEFGWGAACVSQAINLCDLGPGNDDCTNAAEITNCWLSYFDISSAAGDGPTHLAECNWPADLTKDIWYEYTATSTGILSVSVCSDDEPGDPTDPFDLWLGAYFFDGCGPVLEGSLIDCTMGTAACGQGGVILDIPVTQGQGYKIRVAAGIPSLGTGAIETFCIEPGDNVDEPVILGAFEGAVAFDTSDASTDGPAHAACLSGGDDQVHNDVWFLWLAPCTGTLTAETCGAADFDTRLAVYQGCAAAPPSDGNLLGCNDDAAGCPSFRSKLSMPVSSGQCYLIRAGGYNGGSGTGELTISCSPECPADLDGDGSVGIVDFLSLLSAWGPNAGHPADLDGDGAVGIVDFLTLLAAWGPCP